MEEVEYFKRIDNKIEDLKHNKYVKLPFYTVDIKRFFPYVDELRSNVLKFKPDTISKSQNIMKNMKEKYAKVCISLFAIKHRYINIEFTQTLYHVI